MQISQEKKKSDTIPFTTCSVIFKNAKQALWHPTHEETACGRASRMFAELRGGCC